MVHYINNNVTYIIIHLLIIVFMYRQFIIHEINCRYRKPLSLRDKCHKFNYQSLALMLKYLISQAFEFSQKIILI